LLLLIINNTYYVPIIILCRELGIEIENEHVKHSHGGGSISRVLIICILSENWSSRQTKTNPSILVETTCLILYTINLNIII